MGHWWLKSCPKCGGDLFEEVEDEERDIRCLQCARQATDGETLLLLAGISLREVAGVEDLTPIAARVGSLSGRRAQKQLAA
ncbi:MAG: hypothetical protein HYX89_07750 [Chloroflexi bacterium]|nr:hypothetical protein [Chloroflexota bacterium]